MMTERDRDRAVRDILSTDRERLDTLLGELGDLTTLSERLDTLLGEAQNPVPEGKGDGTICEADWWQMRAVCNALHNILGAQGALNLERIKATGLAKLTPAERSALGL